MVVQVYQKGDVLSIAVIKRCLSEMLHTIAMKPCKCSARASLLLLPPEVGVFHRLQHLSGP